MSRRRKSRTMSENRRAFLALRGELFPHVGKIGQMRIPSVFFTADIQWPVIVEKVSVNGKTIWTRLLPPYGRQVARLERFYRVQDDASRPSSCGRYVSNSRRWLREVTFR